MKHTFCVYRSQRVFLRFRYWFSRKTRYVILRAPKYFIVRFFSNSPLKKLIWWFLFLFHLEFKFKKHSNCLYRGQWYFDYSLQKNFLTPFYGQGSTDCLKYTEPLQGGSLLFITKFWKIPATHLINLGRMKGWLDLGATRWLWTKDHWIRNPAP